jgi:putative transposase
MARPHSRENTQLVQQILLDDPDFLRQSVQRVLQQLLEAQITEHVGAAPYERTEHRKRHRNGYKQRTLNTRVGTLELLVPQDREGTFSTSLFARYQRNEKALVLSLMEMYIEGVSVHRGCLHEEGQGGHRGTLWHHLLQELGLSLEH